MNYIIVGEKEVIRSIVRVIPREKISYETPSTIGDVELNFHQYWVTSGDVNYILIEFRDHAESADSNSFTVFSKEDPSFVRKVNWNKCDEMSFVAINMLNKLGDFKGLVDLMEMGLKSVPLSGIDHYLEKKEEAEPTSEMEFLEKVNSVIVPYVDKTEEEMIMEIVKDEMEKYFDSTGVINPRGRWSCRNITIKLPDSNIMCEMDIDKDGWIRFSVESNNLVGFNSGKTIKEEYLQCTIGRDSLSNKLRSLGIPEADISEFYYAFKGSIRNAIQDKNTKLGIATHIYGKNDEKFNLHIKHSSNEGVLIHVERIKEEHRVRSIVDSVKHGTYMEKSNVEDTYIDVVRKYETTIVVTE